jgi:hypothetical protein
MLQANKIEILRKAGNLPKDAERKYLLKKYKGCGAEALNTNNAWLFYMEEFYPLKDFEEAFYAAAGKNVEILNMLWNTHKDSIDDYILHAGWATALTCRNVMCCEWFYDNTKIPKEHSGFWCSKYIEDACKHGDLKFARYIKSICKKDDKISYFSNDFYKKCIVYAVKSNKLEMVQWVHENLDVTENNGAMDVAIGKGLTDIVMYLHSFSDYKVTSFGISNIMKEGSIETLKWVHENYPNASFRNGTENAARYGRLDILQWMHKEGLYNRCAPYGLRDAAKYGHLEVLKWLHEHDHDEYTHYAMDEAAENGFLNVVIWLHENTKAGCTQYAYVKALENGFLSVAVWLHENKQEDIKIKRKNEPTVYFSFVIEKVAKNGHLEVLQWMVMNIPEMRKTVFCLDDAVKNGYLDLVIWCFNHTQRCYLTEVAMDTLAMRGNMSMIRLLCQYNGVRDKLTMSKVARKGNLKMVKQICDYLSELYPAKHEYIASKKKEAMFYAALNIHKPENKGVFMYFCDQNIKLDCNKVRYLIDDANEKYQFLIDYYGRNHFAVKHYRYSMSQKVECEQRECVSCQSSDDVWDGEIDYDSDDSHGYDPDYVGSREWRMEQYGII